MLYVEFLAAASQILFSSFHLHSQCKQLSYLQRDIYLRYLDSPVTFNRAVP